VGRAAPGCRCRPGIPIRPSWPGRCASLREKVTSEADYVGDRFAHEARRIHDHEAEPRGIYGEATLDEAASLLEDGVDFMPLPSLPEEQN